MHHRRIYETSDKFYSVKSLGDFEYANPVDKLIEVIHNISVGVDSDMISLLKRDPKFSSLAYKYPHVLEKFRQQNSLKLFQNVITDILNQPLPKEAFDILESSSRKEQIKILKRITFSTDKLLLFIIKAWEEHGYTFSQYFSKHYPTGIKTEDMPLFAHQEENDEVNIVGNTPLTKGQVKSVINQRHVVVVKFLDKGAKWHCFFQTYRSISGKETGGYSHLHYISHNWGLSREHVLSQLRSKNYKLPSSLPHVRYEDKDEENEDTKAE